MNQQKEPKEKNSTSIVHKVLTVVGIVMCVILIPMLIMNCTLIIKSFVDKDSVPDFGGYMPLIVLTDSMYPDIKSGDLIVCHTIDPEDVKEGNVISFFDPDGNGSSIVTHKVENVINEDGKLSFRTKGINNNTADKTLVPAENVVGIYNGFRIGGAGNVAIFMQSTTGLIVCVLIPFIILVGYDILRRKLYEKNKKDDVETLMAELEALKAEKAAAGAAGNAPSEPAPEAPVSETPEPETPASETPASETPASETPASETPEPETPETETPAETSNDDQAKD